MDDQEFRTIQDATSDSFNHCCRYYRNGAHAGNIHFKIECWGMNSPKIEAAIKSQLDAFISDLQVNSTGS